MGLAASQGRLLLLTAKKSDLEFRAQAISQSRLTLMQQQEGVATKYAEKTSNRCYKLKVNTGDETESMPLTWANMQKYQEELGITLVGRNGKPITDASNSDIRSKLNRDKEGGPDGFMKYAIDTGLVRMQKEDEEGNTVDVTIAGETSFADEYYETDDAAAKSEYDAEMLKVKIKDQRLELDLKGIETQHKAVETETESVQKIIQKNIEVSFKIFS